MTIGSVRYGVRFSPSSPDENTSPSRGSIPNDGDSIEIDHCCDVMQMAWPRTTRGSSLPPSKIPLPNANEKVQANNKRGGGGGKAGEERATAPVYRSVSEVSRPKRIPVSSCFAVESDESNNIGDMKATSPQTPNSSRRPLFAKANFKFGGNAPTPSSSSSSEDKDTSRLIPGTKDDNSTSGNQFQITLDKLQKFRFGGNNDKSAASGAVQKKKKISDKTERLRELTDKLLHSRGPSAGSGDKKKPPTCNSSSSSPSKSISGKQTGGPSLRNFFGSTTSLTGFQSKSGGPKREASIRSVDSGPATQSPKDLDVKSDECKTLSDDDKFDCNIPKPKKTHSKPTISGIAGYAQRINAFRSASFSQVDYDTADGKYTRTLRKNGNESKPGIPSFGCVTFPRVKQVDASTSVSPPPDKVTENAGSTPSVDSAVGSDEGFVIGSSNNLILISEGHKPSGGSRSLTYPFTKKLSKSDEIPFSSIDGNGLKSLHQCSLNRELSDVKEEVSVSSETPTIGGGDTLSVGSNETVREFHEKTCDNSLNNSANNSPNPRVSPNSEKTVYQCMVKEYPMIVSTTEIPVDNSKSVPDKNETLETLETLEREINELIIQQKGSGTSPKPEIYVTTWPKESDVVRDNDSDASEKSKTETKKKNENDDNNFSEKEKGEDDDNNKNDNKSKESETEESKKIDKRWSSDTSNDGSSEPVSVEENYFKNQWTKNVEKPKLTCQSSDERDDDVSANYRRYHLLSRNDSLSEGDSDQGERRPSTPMRDRERTCSPSPYAHNYDLSSDNESKNGRCSHGPRRYSKRPLRGPYGQMLEAEMKKPETTRLLSKKQFSDDLKFLEEYIHPLPEGRVHSNENTRPSSESRLTCPRPRFNAGRSFDDSQLQNVYNTDPRSPSKRKASSTLPFPNGDDAQKDTLVVCHQRTTSSPSQLENFSSGNSSTSVSTSTSATTPTTTTTTSSDVIKGNPQPSQELLAALLKGSSERRYVTEDNPLGNAQNSKVRLTFFFLFLILPLFL